MAIALRANSLRSFVQIGNPADLSSAPRSTTPAPLQLFYIRENFNSVFSIFLSPECDTF
jgi:hypothetical protein